MIKDEKALLLMIGRKIRDARNKKGILMRDAAQRAGMHVNTALRIEDGDNVRLDFVLSYIKAIDDHGDAFRQVFDFSEQQSRAWR